MSLSTNPPGRCAHCGSVLVYAAGDGAFICTNARCKKEQPSNLGPDRIHTDDADKILLGNFGGAPFVALGQMAEEIMQVIDKYALRTSLAETLGTLEIVKLELFDRAKVS